MEKLLLGSLHKRTVPRKAVVHRYGCLGREPLTMDSDPLHPSSPNPQPDPASEEKGPLSLEERIRIKSDITHPDSFPSHYDPDLVEADW